MWSLIFVSYLTCKDTLFHLSTSLLTKKAVKIRKRSPSPSGKLVKMLASSTSKITGFLNRPTMPCFPAWRNFSVFPDRKRGKSEWNYLERPGEAITRSERNTQMEFSTTTNAFMQGRSKMKTIQMWLKNSIWTDKTSTQGRFLSSRWPYSGG